MGEKMIKLIIQIPCYNEENTLPQTLAEIPRQIPGIDKIEILVIDDGSTDQTLKVAENSGVDHLIRFNRNRGLAQAFDVGIEESLKLGADVIVNTDADNQYSGFDIPKLVSPILAGEADMVIGERQIERINHISWLKKKLNVIGSRVISWLSRTTVKDASSGFRAFSRYAAIRINTLTEFSYTFENIIQMGFQKLKIVTVPIQVNYKTRESRLFRSIAGFLVQQLKTVVKVYATYRALKVFFVMGLFILIPGLFGFLRFLYFYFVRNSEGHIQSLIFSTLLIIIGFLFFTIGLVADLISQNRKLIEKLLNKVKEFEADRQEK
jgi:glycosyltransferase involved in cell wall biosynthesis